MKRLILAMAVIAISTATVQAQDKMSPKKTVISIAVNAGIPTTTNITAKESISFVMGGDIQADFGVAKSLKITLSGGLENYSVKGDKLSSRSIIPLLGGVKFLFSDKFYGHAQLGYGIGQVGGSGAFAYAPSIGYNFSPKFDASVKYLAFSTSTLNVGSVNLRLAYDF